jgi:hypothetical protein
VSELATFVHVLNVVIGGLLCRVMNSKLLMACYTHWDWESMPFSSRLRKYVI